MRTIEVRLVRCFITLAFFPCACLAAVFNVATYGASTANSNNAPFIQAAIDAARLAGGGEVYFPDYYRCTAGVVIANAANIQLRGAGGRAGMFFENDSVIPQAILINTSQNIEVSNLWITGSTTPTTVARLIRIRGGERTTLRNNYLSGANRAPPDGPLAAVAVMDVGTRDLRIEGNRFSANGPPDSVLGYDIVNWASAQSSEIVIRENRISEGTTSASVAIYDAINVRVEGNYIDQNNQMAPGDNNGYGVILYRVSGPVGQASITGNTVRNTAGSAIYLASVGGSDGDIAIQNNKLIDVAKQQQNISLPVAGISINGSSRLLITGNRIQGSGRNGIELSTVDAAMVDSNIIEGSANWGIRLRYGVTSTALTGNRLFNNWQPYTLSGGTSTTISGNRFTNGALQGQVMLVGGAATVSTAEIQAGDQVMLTRQANTGTPGVVTLGTINTGASFSVVSSSASDQGTIGWQIVH